MNKELSEKDIKAIAVSRWFNDNRIPLMIFASIGLITTWVAFFTLEILILIPSFAIVLVGCWKLERFVNKFHKEWINGDEKTS